jgi:ATP-dependent helicase/nuclease subunit B
VPDDQAANRPKAAEDTGAPSSSLLWREEAGAVARRFFDELFVPGRLQPEISPFDYPDLFRALLSGENVREHRPVHPRLSIWGPFEARLQQTDVMVMGSLNDGTWPEAADPGPWLNRSMRKRLRLPSPEEKIGHAAHDFVSFFGAERVVLTRSLKVDGVPTVPSRWLMRLNALLAGLGLEGKLAADTRYLRWARARDEADLVPPVAVPAPRPPLELRPRKLSVSRVEAWMANPYSIFAREILGLESIDAIGTPPGPALRGTIIHAALADFARAYPDKLPEDVRGALMAFAAQEFAELAANPRVAAFWLPRFRRIAEWFAETEPARRERLVRTVAETRGSLVFAAPAGPFTLTARADRIDVCENGLIITDYKTGALPKPGQVRAGIRPQLILEAAISNQGMFAGVPKSPLVRLTYLRASGGEPPGEEAILKGADLPELAERAQAGLEALVAHFDDPTTPYAPKRRHRFDYAYDAYAHLARVAEWSGETGRGEEG